MSTVRAATDPEAAAYHGRRSAFCCGLYRAAAISVPAVAVARAFRAHLRRSHEIVHCGWAVHLGGGLEAVAGEAAATAAEEATNSQQRHRRADG